MMPNADGRRELPRRRNSGSPTSENSEKANFGEFRKAEVLLRRIPLPRTRVNKGKQNKPSRKVRDAWQDHRRRKSESRVGTGTSVVPAEDGRARGSMPH